jgi:hypothetical protein
MMKKVGLIKDIKLKEETPLVDVNFTHALCIGQTGSGKTTSFIYPNVKKRMELKHGILFFDIKGSEHLALKKLASDEGRLDDIVEIGKPWGSNINIVKSLNSRTFETLLKNLVGDPATAGSNTYFYNEAISLGLSLYSTFKLQSIISKEIREISDSHLPSLQERELFSLSDIYSTIYNIDSLYSFIQETKKFKTQLHEFIINNSDYYTSQHSDRYKNLVLNYVNLKNTIEYFKKYDVTEEDRSSSEKFETSLLSVISTLSSGFNFMNSASSKYISQKENPLNIVEALQKKKIIIINVRVIPDVILELMLDQLFEQMIDLNLQNEDDKKPISVFIDEAQRLINKDIPLDVLRSSKVDLLMAVQSELQLISKFNSREDWQQISVNIAQKYAFKSIYFGGDHLLSFYVETATLNTFEYAKEHEHSKLRAKPIFLNKDEFPSIEYKYQKEVLQLKEIGSDEILFYDVTHFENEREIVLINIKTKAKKHKKLFTQIQESIIDQELKAYIKLPYNTMLNSELVKGKIPKNKYKIMYEKYNIYNEEKLKEVSSVLSMPSLFETLDKLFLSLFMLGIYGNNYKHNHSIYNLFKSLSENQYKNEILLDEEEQEESVQVLSKQAQKSLIKSLEEFGIFIVPEDNYFRLYIMEELLPRGEETIFEFTIHYEDMDF